MVDVSEFSNEKLKLKSKKIRKNIYDLTAIESFRAKFNDAYSNDNEKADQSHASSRKSSMKKLSN